MPRDVSAGPPVPQKQAVLVTSGAVDGYPPVGHQARLLARAGFAVEIVTPLLAGRADVAFACPGVRITPVTSGGGTTGKALRYARFYAAIGRARRRAGPDAIEIAYDPLGMAYSDFAPFRPRFRVAHFHEMLQQYGSVWYETRLGRAIPGYQLVVAADEARAAVLRKQLNLSLPVLAVPNYPLCSAPSGQRMGGQGPFEVVYAGSIGEQQKIDLLIDSMPLWPADTMLTIIGGTQGPHVARLKTRAASLAVSDRVRFPGWIDYDRIEARLRQADLGVALLDPSFEQWRTALGASNKRYQYMQAGLPQIGDMNPGVPELLEGNRIGLCIRDYAPASVAAIVAAYASDPERCREEGARARVLHETRFNYERAFEPVLARILAASPRASHSTHAERTHGS